MNPRSPSDQRDEPERLVDVDLVEGIATITLDSQHNRNALSRRLLGELLEAIDAAEVAEARAIVLRHEGPAFCSGVDLKERAASPDDPGPFVEVMTRLMDTARPTIAAVAGAVRAGGFGLMTSCDLVVVDRSVTFALTEVRLGLVAGMVSVPILRRVAPSRIASALFTGEVFDAATALEIGLITHVTDDVDARVAAIVADLRLGAPRAIAATKRLLATIPGLSRDDAFGLATTISNDFFAGDDGAEGMAAFRDKRPPRWQLDA